MASLLPSKNVVRNVINFFVFNKFNLIRIAKICIIKVPWGIDLKYHFGYASYNVFNSILYVLRNCHWIYAHMRHSDGIGEAIM